MAFSANAILTKSRAMYGRRLTAQNYTELLGCSRVSDVANYLSSNTQYSTAFSEGTSSSVNRNIIENSLRKHLLGKFESLGRFQRAIGQELYRYFIIRNEIDEIISCIRYLKTPNADEYLMKMPAFLNSLTTIDLYALAKSQSFAEVIKNLEGSDYEEILKPFAVNEDDTDLMGIEAALFKYLSEKTEEFAKDSLKGGELKEFIFAVRFISDLKMIANIYRLKFIFNVRSEAVRDYPVVSQNTNLEEKYIDGLCGAKTTEEFREVLSSTQYGSGLDKNEFISIENWLERYKYSRASNRLRFSTYPSVVMFCGIILAEIEIMNVIHLTEGIKYHVPQEEIKKLLIGVETTESEE